MTAELACSRDAFTTAEKQRYDEIMAAWTSAIEAREPLPNGLEFTLTDHGTMQATLEDFVSFERRCCPFLEFSVEAASPSRITFRMTGPPGTREFLLSQ